MDVTRRELCLALSGALVPALLRAEDSGQQAGPLPSTMYPYDKLSVQTSNGAHFRAVLKSKLATGESLEVHETTLPPGGAPHPPPSRNPPPWTARRGPPSCRLAAGHCHPPQRDPD